MGFSVYRRSLIIWSPVIGYPYYVCWYGAPRVWGSDNKPPPLYAVALHRCLVNRAQVLDLESNSVSDVEQAVQLGTCPRLWSLTLTSNPVCRDAWYRKRVVEAVPQLATLDDENVTGLLLLLLLLLSALLLLLLLPLLLLL